MSTQSKIIIGCMSWGNWGKQFSTKEQADMINFCVANGNITFDHADIYGHYTTEKEFGKAFAQTGIKRENIQLISKCGIQLVSENRNNSIKHYNTSKDYIISSAEASLKNLKTEYLDTFLLHRPSPLMHPDEIAEAINTLKEDGKIKSFGVSNFTTSQLELISSTTNVAVNQIEFSLTQHKAMHDGTLDYMLQHHIQPMIWSPLGNVYREDTEQTFRTKKLLSSLAKKYNVSDATVLLAWILKHPAKPSPIIGTTNKGRIEASNQALDIDLELEDWFALLAESQGHEVA
ncbi:aldo/keto reductase [Seonamhaeicola marinus]|nr:aldo/keto reductase [Seonamhaeicola marinus]